MEMSGAFDYEKEDKEMLKELTKSKHRPDCDGKDQSSCNICPEHPHWMWDDAPYQQCHDRDQHEGDNTCKCIAEG